MFCCIHLANEIFLGAARRCWGKNTYYISARQKRELQNGALGRVQEKPFKRNFLDMDHLASRDWEEVRRFGKELNGDGSDEKMSVGVEPTSKIGLKEKEWDKRYEWD